MAHRPWDWTDRVLAEHGDQQHQRDAYFAGRAEVERSHWWWMKRRWEQEMAEIMERMAS